MFQFHTDGTIQSHREMMNHKILGSFKSEDKNYKASLIKGLTFDEFEAAYPSDQYERFSFRAIEKFKDDLRKANENDLQKAETIFAEEDTRLNPVVVQQGIEKKIVFVRKKA